MVKEIALYNRQNWSYSDRLYFEQKIDHTGSHVTAKVIENNQGTHII